MCNFIRHNRYAIGQIPACIVADKLGGKFTLGFAICGTKRLQVHLFHQLYSIKWTIRCHLWLTGLCWDLLCFFVFSQFVSALMVMLCCVHLCRIECFDSLRSSRESHFFLSGPHSACFHRSIAGSNFSIMLLLLPTVSIGQHAVMMMTPRLRSRRTLIFVFALALFMATWRWVPISEKTVLITFNLAGMYMVGTMLFWYICSLLFTTLC